MVLGACVQGDTAAPSDADAHPEDAVIAVPGNTVLGRVDYQGDEDGRLTIALFEQLPVSGPPIHFTRIAIPSFPQEFAIYDVETGEYEVLVVLDLGPENPTVPGLEDVQARAGRIEVDNNVGAWLTVELITQEVR